MKALQVTRNARPSEALEIVELDPPQPGPGQVRIRVAAGSLNFNDIDRCYGRVTTVPMPPPFVLGMDACGVVEPDAAARSLASLDYMLMSMRAESTIVTNALLNHSPSRSPRTTPHP